MGLWRRRLAKVGLPFGAAALAGGLVPLERPVNVLLLHVNLPAKGLKCRNDP